MESKKKIISIMASSEKPLYKYRSLNNRTLEMFINREIYFAEIRKLNDPFDCQISADKFLNWENPIIKNRLDSFNLSVLASLASVDAMGRMSKLAEECGIFSLSKRNDDVTMWSHYADQHSGICVGFDETPKIVEGSKDPPLDELSKYFSCHYLGDDKIPLVEYFKYHAPISRPVRPGIGQLLLTSLFVYWVTTKSNAWKHEEEVRGIRPFSGMEKYDPKMIGEIIFGLRMKDSDRRTIKNLLVGDDWKHIKYRIAKRNEYGFGITIQDDDGK